MALLLIGLSTSVYSESDITFKVGHQSVDGSYSSTSIKKSLKSNGVIFNIEYLDDWSITHTSTDTKIKFIEPDLFGRFINAVLYTNQFSESDLNEIYNTVLDTNQISESDLREIWYSGVDPTGLIGNILLEVGVIDNNNTIEQTSEFTSISYNLYSDDYGKINLRTDYHHIDNNDTTGATDDIRINSYQASVFPYDSSYYAEIGFSKSKYPYTGHQTYSTPLTVKQFNASYAKSMTGVDWLTLKAYRINSSDKDRSHNKENHNALEIKYKYFLSENPININNVELYTLSGSRIFAVDGAAGSAYNMGDLQIGSVGLSAEWKFSENTNLLASVSREKYRTDADVNYTGNYKYLNFNYNF
jgi:hypothetical protein